MDNWQTRAAKFGQDHNLSQSPSVYALDLTSELGEVAKEILLATEYGKRPFQSTPNLADELGDTLYSLCQLATAANIDLEKAFAAAIAKYEQRWRTKKHIGSVDK